MADNGNWYNGYSPKERNKKLREFNQRVAKGNQRVPCGPCALCGDPDVDVEYHDEDYGEPFTWDEPATFALCRHCHRYKLHMRFANPEVWQVFIAHVRRGGYASQLKDPCIKEELKAYRAALKKHDKFELRKLSTYTPIVGEEWFAKLRMDPESLKDTTARPRPLASPAVIE